MKTASEAPDVVFQINFVEEEDPDDWDVLRKAIIQVRSDRTMAIRAMHVENRSSTCVDILVLEPAVRALYESLKQLYADAPDERN